MSVNRVCIDKAVAFFNDWRIVLPNDEDILNTGCRLGPKTLAIYLHVGNVGIIGTVAWACELLARRIRMEPELIGFDVKFTPCKDNGRYVGLELRSQPAQWVQLAIDWQRRMPFLESR